MSIRQRSPFTWTREITSDLISLYELQPLLYQTSLKDYKNRSRRYEAIEFIKNELIVRYPVQCNNLVIDDVVKKIHGIRTQYLKEVNVIKKMEAGDNSADGYLPKLWCFDSLRFLSECDSIRHIENNLEMSEIKQENLNVEPEMNDPLESSNISCSTTTDDISSSFSGSKRKASNTPVVSDLVKSLEEHIKRKRLDVDDEFDLFGKTVAAELRKVKNIQKLKELKKSIFSHIIDAQ